jgi:hypothetical protein
VLPQNKRLTLFLYIISGSTTSHLQLPNDPTELSYWVAQALPLLDEQRLSLLQINSPIQRLRWELCVLEKVIMIPFKIYEGILDRT